MLDHGEQGAVEIHPRPLVLGPGREGGAVAEAALAEQVEHGERAILAGRLVLDHVEEAGEAPLGVRGELARAAVLEVVVDRDPEVFGARVALRRIAPHRLLADGARLGREAGREARLRSEGAREARLRRRPVVRRRAREDLVEDRAEQVDVRAGGERGPAAREHLGRHVAGRARDLRRVDRERQPPARVVARADGDPPVEHVHLAERADHHVLRLQVAVHDAAAVREVHRVAHARERSQVPLQRVERGEAPRDLRRVVHELRPLAALDPLHDDHGRPVGVDADVVHRDHVRVLERARDPRLAQDPQRRLDVAHARAQRLHRHVPAERRLGREVHDAHAPLAERVSHGDAPMERGAQRAQLLERGRRARVGRATRRHRLSRLLDQGPRELRVVRAEAFERLGEFGIVHSVRGVDPSRPRAAPPLPPPCPRGGAPLNTEPVRRRQLGGADGHRGQGRGITRVASSASASSGRASSTRPTALRPASSRACGPSRPRCCTPR